MSRAAGTSAFLSQNHFLLGFALMSLLGGMSFGIARVITSLYALELEASPLQMGVIAASQSIGLLVMGLPVGMLVDHYGPRRLFIFGSLLAGLFYALVPLWRSPEYLALCAACVSFCVPCRFVSLNAVFMEKLSELGEAKAGWYRGNALIGMLLIGPALAVGLQRLMGSRGVFLFVALSIWGVILLARQLLEGRVIVRARPSLSPRAVAARVRALFAQAELRETALIEFFSQAAIGYFSFFIVPIAVREFGFSSAAAARLITFEGLMFVFALFFLGVLVTRIGPRKAYLAGFCGGILALLILALASGPAALWGGSLVLGLSFGLLQVLTLGHFAQLSAASGRGEIAGLIALIGPSGALFGSMLGGLWASWASMQSMFGCLLLPLLVFAWRAVRQGRRTLAVSAV